MKLDERKIICRRALREIQADDIVNLGIGLPEGISIVANEYGVFERMKLTVEAGVIGGIPAGGLNFGTAYNPECFIDQPSQFDYYDGGGLDVAFLGMAQADKYGNVNVSKFGKRLAGCGGFIDISHSTKKVVFCGTFTSGGLEIKVSGGRLEIVSEGEHKKFLDSVEQITFNGRYAKSKGHEIMFITERCVFELTGTGMLLTEVASGIDIDRHIKKQMDFIPDIARNLKIMDSSFFID
jgi:propionate CoA-transferase